MYLNLNLSFLKSTARRIETDNFIFYYEISHSDISGIATKAPCEAALMGAVSYTHLDVYKRQR